MAIYTVVVKRGDIEYSVSGENREFILSQIDVIFSDLKNRKSRRGDDAFTKLAIEPAHKPEKQENNFEVEKREEPISETLSELTTFLEPQEAPQEEYKEESQDVGDIHSAEVEKEPYAEESQIADEEPQAVEETAEPEEYLPQQEEVVPQEFDFENILEEKINNVAFVEESNENLTVSYEEAISRANPEVKLDYLIITAYYMFENENQPVFQLKQLNAKLFNTLKIVVDRKTVQKAVEDGFLEIVSDGLYNDGIVEYSLTQAGREYYVSKSA